MSLREADERLPVTILTGFLGSGKTTVLRRLLADPTLSDTAVLINEFGETGLDHILVADLTDAPVLLGGGCICCAIRGDLKLALQRLELQRARCEAPLFRRVVIETTGLADPTPVLATIVSDRSVRRRFRIAGVAATVDAVHAEAALGRHPEVLKQILAADQLLVTKADLVTSDVVERLRATLHQMNPAAEVSDPASGAAGLAAMLDGLGSLATERGRFTAGSASAAPVRTVWSSAGHSHADLDAAENLRHLTGIRSSVLTFEGPIPWTAFGMWLTLLVHRHGAKLLRMKGVLNVEGSDRPVAVHVVQHLIHPPEHLAPGADSSGSSRLVVISEGLDVTLLHRSCGVFMGALAVGRKHADG